MGALHHPTLPFLLLLLLLASSALGFFPSPQFRGGGEVEAWQRRGPGSWPPACRYRCGRCAPCRAVHVAIRPGKRAAPMEYYPEAWRCKCGNKLFMP